MKSQNEILAAADRAAREIFKRSDWADLSDATYDAILAHVKAGYTQGLLDQAIDHAKRLLDEAAGRAEQSAAEFDRLARELAPKPAESMSDITVICPDCGATDNLMVPSSRYPDLHTVTQRCSRCSSM